MRHHLFIVLLALLTPLSVCVGPVGMVRAFQTQPTESEQTTGSSQSTESAAWQRREEASLDQMEVVIAQRLPELVRRLSLVSPGVLSTVPPSGHRLANGLNAPLRT